MDRRVKSREFSRYPNSNVISSGILASVEETIAFGKTLAGELSCGTVLCFTGDLGTGKTTLIKGIVEGLTGVEASSVTSPTFTYLQIYGKKPSVYHFDLYRLESEEDFLALGFEEFLFGDGICCIEWSERIARLLPESVKRIHLEHINESERMISLI